MGDVSNIRHMKKRGRVTYNTGHCIEHSPYIGIDVCICIFLYIWIYVYMYICIYMYI